jgi:hypothetical protein
MDKGIGFNRNILLPWLEAAARFRLESDSPEVIRERLQGVLGERLRSAENRRKAIDILINIWVHSREASAALYDEGLARFPTAQGPDQRIAVHYGMVLLAYPFFREAVAVIGQLGRRGSRVSSGEVKRRLMATRGQLGSLGKAVERVVYSLRDWGLLEDTGQQHIYAVPGRQREVGDAGLQAWLLACALTSHPAEELPYLDLVRLPELFPFHITMGLDALRASPHFAVSRQGGGWEAVRLAR